MVAVYPPVAVLVPAFNEATTIGAKLRNLSSSTYPGPLRVVVVSDGSVDETVARVRELRDPRVTLVISPMRRGKMGALNLGMREIHESVVVLTDAQELFAPDAIRLLVEGLADPRVGVVSGAVQMIDTHTGFSQNLGAYWTYECWLRRNESCCGSTMGASGAIYAIRRACFRSLPEDTILDDVALPFEVLRQGYLVKSAPGAVAFEYATTEPGQEYARKRRTLAGNYQLISRYRDLLWRRDVAFQFWSHKVFRLLVPYAMVGAFAGTFGLPPVLLGLSLAAHILFYGLALFAVVARRPIRVPVLSFPYTFCVLNFAAIAGSYDYLSGRQRGLWERSK